MRSVLSKVVTAALLVAGLTFVPDAGVDAAPSAAPSSGVNDWRCQLSPQRPNPVVMLHGLGGNGPGNWAFMAPALADAGHCVFHLTYGQASPFIPVGGTRPIAESAQEIARFVDRVQAATDAPQVDLVGHSEGGFLSLYIPKVLDRGDDIGTVVALAPPTHGTTFADLVPLGDFLGLRPLVDLVLNTFGCQACSDLITDGAAVNELTDGPIAVPGVDYTIIATRFDALVTPVETAFVDEPGVDNRFVQDECPSDPVGHVGLAFDGGVATMVANALDPDTASPVRCSVGPPL